MTIPFTLDNRNQLLNLQILNNEITNKNSNTSGLPFRLTQPLCAHRTYRDSFSHTLKLNSTKPKSTLHPLTHRFHYSNTSNHPNKSHVVLVLSVYRRPTCAAKRVKRLGEFPSDPESHRLICCLNVFALQNIKYVHPQLWALLRITKFRYK